MSDLKTRLHGLCDEILTWSLQVQNNMQEAEQSQFGELEIKLTLILQEVLTYQGEDKQELNDIVNTFQTQIQQQYEVTKAKMTELSQDLNTTAQYTKAVKAYSQS